MRLTITTLTDEIFTFEVSDDMDLQNFRALCELETGIAAREIVVFWNGRPLHDDRRTLHEYGIHDGDVLLLQRVQGARGQPAAGRQMSPMSGGAAAAATPVIDFSQIQVPSTSLPVAERSPSPVSPTSPSEDPATLREMLLASPHDLAMLKERNPPLADALLSGSLEKFTEVLNKQRQEKVEREQERIRLLSADPFDPEAQRLIAEEIRLKNVEHNMETAIEHAPESFGQVIMLYINCLVNGHPVKAFVDSGAQMTIMSRACADRCNIMRLVDKRWAGIAKGVGTQKIIGRVHLCQIQIDSIFLQTSFSILEDQPMDMLLGLDMLKRHQCIIDLRNNILHIGNTKTQFLSESELPDYARLNQPMPMDEGRQLIEAMERSEEDAAAQLLISGPSTSGASSSGGEVPQQLRRAIAESDIQRLVGYGFSRQQVIDELTKNDGDVDQALASLFAKSFQMP